MKNSLMISVSGIRGIGGNGLSPELIANYSAAMGTYIGPGPVMIGRDTRVTGEMVWHAVCSGLMAVGCDPIDLGIVPTPTTQLAVEKSNALAGIMITASHNPIEWNGLKFIGEEGLFFDEAQGLEVKRIVESKSFRYVPWDKIGHFSTKTDAIRDHIEAILSIPYLDVQAIRKRKFKVAFDTVNGTGGLILPELLKALGCEVYPLHAEPHGRFSRNPEPLPEHLTELSKWVLKYNADIGFALDPDGDRCAIVAENGTPIGEEYTVALAVQFVLSKKRGPVVVNVSTTRAVDDIASQFGISVIRTKVGEIHVAKKMKECQAVIGGEGNGGVILPDVHLGRDGPVAVALTLQSLIESDKPISQVWHSLPQYHMAKKKISIDSGDPQLIFQKLEALYASEKTNTLDGLKIDRPDSWVQIRKSNTEPILRVMAEAPTAEQALSLCQSMIEKIQQIK